jgi:peroxiredoxin family protein
MSDSATVESLREEIRDLRARLDRLESAAADSALDDSVSIVCFSGEWDRLYAAFTIANGALALGQDVHMFFTFWGATAVRCKGGGPALKRHWMQRMLGGMLPADIHAAKLSKMHFLGLGKWMMRVLMKHKNVADLPQLMSEARELGAHFYYCDTSLSLFGWGNSDLVDGDDSEWCGVSTFLSKALKSRVTLFV